MNKDRFHIISEIIPFYLDNRFPDNEEATIQGWIVDSYCAEEKDTALHEYWISFRTETDKNIYKILERVKLRAGIRDTTESNKVPLSRYWLRVAAVVLPFIVLLGSYFFSNRMDGKLNPGLVEVVALAGERKHVVLPDGSEVLLKSGKLTYPEKFVGAERRVVLNSGDASFKIAKDSLRPFISEAKHLLVRVLGTEYDMRTSSDQDIVAVTLFSGKAQVELQNNGVFRLLPSQQLTFNTATGKVSVKKIDSKGAFSDWRNGHLTFNEATFEDIVETLQLHYNLTIEVDPSLYTKDDYTVKFTDNEGLEEVMEVLEDMIGGFSHTITKDDNGRQVVVIVRI
jgi:ferric-dicitrate binding protein FerR (iron transport regulator)